MPVQWTKQKSAAGSSFDGVVIERKFPPGVTELQANINFYVETVPQRYELSEALRKVLGIQEESRAKVVAALWQYIKSNRLQDPEERRYVNLNNELQSVFGPEEKVEFHKLMQLLKPHLHEAKPLAVAIDIRKDALKSSSQHAMAVHLQSENRQKLLEFLADHNYSFEFNQEEVDKSDQSLVGTLKRRQLKSNLKIAAAIEQMKRNARHMHFYNRMAQNPKDTIQSTIVDQNSYLQILQGETPFMHTGFKTEGQAPAIVQAP
jgi:SWI/SNF-related matrix-associated actin-dependent regulator of chromatin subfamily D